MNDLEATTFAGWAILELMGHRRLGGYVQERTIAGAGFLRIDVPGRIYTTDAGEQEERDEATQFYPPSSVYCLTPVTEDVAREFAARSWQTPARMLGLPSPMTATLGEHFVELDEPQDDDEPEDDGTF